MELTTDIPTPPNSVGRVRMTTKQRGAMKVQFNLTKEEAEAFTNFYNSVNVNNITESDFCKSAFVIGLQAMEASIIAEVKKRMEQEQGDVEIVEDTEEATDDTVATEE